MTDTEAVRLLFDELAHGYDQHLGFFSSFGRALVGWTRLEAGQHVVDVGAGRGAITLPAVAAVGTCGQVTAVDNSGAMLAALAEDCRGLPQVQLQVMDAHSLDIADASVDSVLCGFVLHFLDKPAQAIGEVYRVLRPGGRLSFSGPPTGPTDNAPRDPRWAFYGELTAEVAQRSGSPRHSELFSAPARPLPALCTEAGFIDLEQHRPSITFSYRDPEHYWNWLQSHGFRGYIDSLNERLADEFRSRLMTELQHLHEHGGITTEPDVVFTRMTKPGSSDGPDLGGSPP